MTIWHDSLDLLQLNKVGEGTAVSNLGINFIEFGTDWLKATMPVDHRTKQPFGVLHGGASVLLAETMGSMASMLCLDKKTHYCVGLDINANHVRSATEGFVTGIVRPIHLGRTTHVWEIRITDEAERLVCISRLTMAILTNRQG